MEYFQPAKKYKNVAITNGKTQLKVGSPMTLLAYIYMGIRMAWPTRTCGALALEAAPWAPTTMALIGTHSGLMETIQG